LQTNSSLKSSSVLRVIALHFKPLLAPLRDLASQILAHKPLSIFLGIVPKQSA
jgi:hypothetical protein